MRRRHGQRVERVPEAAAEVGHQDVDPRVRRQRAHLGNALGETDAEVLDVLRELREHHVDMITIGQ